MSSYINKKISILTDLLNAQKNMNKTLKIHFPLSQCLDDSVKLCSSFEERINQLSSKTKGKVSHLEIHVQNADTIGMVLWMDSMILAVEHMPADSTFSVIETVYWKMINYCGDKITNRDVELVETTGTTYSVEEMDIDIGEAIKSIFQRRACGEGS